ncbi:hypothetical protein GGI08_001817 [Coemansia sp. S2]|nr:hypothetical protein H4S03_000046 [Coemansia sp. S3946]KAJ2066540.1 hypothetical protein GGI08_001817 [Coemansia sp. S2]KAJ2104349.1 hypothetical protein GGI09_000160 [Coemansia sp. S100]KAJ2110038.1 hypothetical protein GGI16_000474 [Coemansia sp. S142-1]KAJ2350363.1 hypothetical protein GGH92_002332 [Coemansia sp. RSA 2673]KAJ2432196.1 hypothetical protein GGF41_000127 [Coemansia sp. RSA 2531]
MTEFFDQCNEYLKGLEHTELSVVWCDYTKLASKFEAQDASDELHLCMVGLYMENKFIGVKSADDFVTAVNEAITRDHDVKPKHVLYGGDEYSWPRCMCCCGSHDKVMETRKKNIDIVARLLHPEPVAGAN